MTKVYILWHTHELDGHEEELMLGAYSTPEKAATAMAHLRTQPGFKDQPDGFEIKDCTIDRMYMAEGFVTLLPGED